MGSRINFRGITNEPSGCSWRLFLAQVSRILFRNACLIGLTQTCNFGAGVTVCDRDTARMHHQATTKKVPMKKPDGLRPVAIAVLSATLALSPISAVPALATPTVNSLADDPAPVIAMEEQATLPKAPLGTTQLCSEVLRRLETQSLAEQGTDYMVCQSDPSEGAPPTTEPLATIAKLPPECPTTIGAANMNRFAYWWARLIGMG